MLSTRPAMAVLPTLLLLQGQEGCAYCTCGFTDFTDYRAQSSLLPAAPELLPRLPQRLLNFQLRSACSAWSHDYPHSKDEKTGAQKAQLETDGSSKSKPCSLMGNTGWETQPEKLRSEGRGKE
ncbi:uncharacterized protein LOC128930325 [Callithrix jacchus]